MAVEGVHEDAGPASSQLPRKRARASIACTACNQRKTKCDVAQTAQPCTKCREHGRDCRLMETKRGKYDRSHMYMKGSTSNTRRTPPEVTSSNSPQASQSGSASSKTVDQQQVNSGSHRPSVQPFSTFDILFQNSDARDLARPSGEASGSSNIPPLPQPSTFRSPPVDVPQNPLATHTILPSPSTVQPPPAPSYTDQTMPSHFSPLTQTALAMPGTEQNYNFDFGESAPPLMPGITNAVASSSALSSVSQNPPNQASSEQAGDTNEWTDLMAIPVEKLDEAHDSHNVMYAGNLFTLSHLLRQHWKSQDSTKVSEDRLHFPGSMPTTSNASLITQEQHHLQLQFLSQIGCFTLPPKQVLDRMVSAYFNYFHPVYPVLSRARFYQQYETVLSGGVPMLLLWGMLYVSSTLCELEDLKTAGFNSRFEALRSFCVRGKALYNASFDRDKVNVVTFEFLISQIWSDGEDSFLWSGRAATTAQSMGMHRTTANSKLVDEDRRLWRRVWWAVYIRDRHAAAATGRPYRIHEDFNDIELPQREDFDTEESFLRFFYSVKLAKLVSKVVECKMIVNKEYEVIQRAVCYQGLTEWLNSLPSHLSSSHAATDIFTAFLHLSYHCWVIHLFRPGSEEEENSPIASQSAAAATRLFEDLLQQGRVGQGPQFTVTCLFAAMAQHVADRRSSTGTMRTICSHRLTVCRLAAKELAGMRPVAAWFRRMFHSLDTRTPDDEDTANRAPINSSLANLLNIPQDSSFANQNQPLGATGSGEPSALFADFFWGMPAEYPDDTAIDWLLNTY